MKIPLFLKLVVVFLFDIQTQGISPYILPLIIAAAMPLWHQRVESISLAFISGVGVFFHIFYLFSWHFCFCVVWLECLGVDFLMSFSSKDYEPCDPCFAEALFLFPFTVSK